MGFGYTRIEEELYDCLAEAAGRDTESSGAGEKAARKRPEGIRRKKAGQDGLFAATEGEKDSMNILLFTTESCSSCDKVKAFLEGAADGDGDREGSLLCEYTGAFRDGRGECRLSAAAV